MKYKEIAYALFLSLRFCLAVTQIAPHSTRVVVTFYSPDEARGWYNIENTTVVKQYGRRLVLNLGREVEIETDGPRIEDEIGLGLVESVELDYIIGSSDGEMVYAMAGDMMMSQPNIFQWNLADSEPYSIKAEGIWNRTNSTPDVVVAVLDTGLASVARGVFLHLDPGYDFISDSSISLDGDGRDADSTDPGDSGPGCPSASWHGTKVASILAAGHDPAMGLGMRGVAQNATVMPMRVLGLCSSGYANDVADAIVYSAGGQIDGLELNPTPARVITMSFAGMGECPSYLQSAVNQALQSEVILVAAAGNSADDVLNYFPANCHGVISVGASTRDGNLASYSNRGSTMTLMSPGGDSSNPISVIYTDQGKTSLVQGFSIGTSMAAPHIAGIAALYISWKNCSSCFKDMANSFNAKLDAMSVYNKNHSSQINANNSLVFSSMVFAVESTCCTTCRNSASCYDNSICILGGDWCRDQCNAAYGCGVGNYITNCAQIDDGPLSANLCSACSCTNGYYKTGGCDGFDNAQCTLCRTCGSGTIESQSCTTSSNRVCGPCPAGYYCDGTDSGTRKDICPAGYYCPSGSSAKIVCPNGVYCPSQGMSAGNACTAGYYCTITGSIGATSQTPCPVCAADQYQQTPCTVDGGPGLCATCSVCPANNYRLSCTSAGGTCSTCSQCQAGKFRSGGCTGTTNSACSDCPSNSNSAAGATSISGCSCNAGYYMNSGTCTACPQYTSSLAGATSVSGCTCSPGFYLDSFCTVCPSGKHKSSLGNEACTGCPANANSVPGSTASTACTCNQGYYGSNGATCTGCETGYYCSGGTSKIQCTANSNSPVRSTLSSQCTCNPGSYVTGATCTLCTTGVTYSTTSGASACNTCTKCGAGKYQTSACTATTDTTCANCQDKFYSLSLHNTECISCGTLQTPPTGQYRKDCNAASQGTLSNCVATKF